MEMHLNTPLFIFLFYQFLFFKALASANGFFFVKLQLFICLFFFQNFEKWHKKIKQY